MMERLESVRFVFPVPAPGRPGAVLQAAKGSDCEIHVEASYVRLVAGANVVRVPLPNVAAIVYQEIPVDAPRQSRPARPGRA
jgi:hypothetical protein